MAVKTFYASKDAMMGSPVGQGHGGWNGKDNHIQVGFDGTNRVRGLVYFPINFTDMWSITSAKMYLITSTNGANHAVQSAAPTSMVTRMMTEDWGEGSIDPGEGNFDGSMNWYWGNRLNSYSTLGQATTSIDQDASGTEEEIDITDIVNYWHLGNPNFGVQLFNATSESTDSTRALLFTSREAGAEFRPRLEITYTTNTPPSAPTLNSPINGAVVQTLVPALSFTRNDVDAGDYISAASIEVFDGWYRMIWETSTSSGPPTGRVRINNSNYSSATQMFIHEVAQDGAQLAAFFDSLSVVNNVILLQDSTGTVVVKFQYNSTAADLGTSRTFNITHISSNGTFVNGATVFFKISTTIGQNDSNAYGAPIWQYSGSPTSVITSMTVPYGSTENAFPVYPAPALVGNKDYSWRARTRDQGLALSEWSKNVIFRTNSAPNAPTVSVSPEPLSAMATDTPVFTITHNDNDANDTRMFGYQIIVEKETSAGAGDWTVAWDTGQVDSSGSAATTKQITSVSLAFATSHRVKARTRDSNQAWGAFSPTIPFTTQGTSAPINLAPSNNGTAPATPTFSGERASAGYSITSYQIIVYSDDLSTQMWDSGTLSTGITGGSSFSKIYAGSALSAGSFYKWKVRVTSSFGTSSYSDLQRFEVSSALVPTPSAPIGGGISDLTPDFVGSRASSFNRFQVQLFPSTATTQVPGTPIWDSGTLSSTIGAGGLGTQFTTTYPGSPALTHGSVYKWRARVSSDAGASWSDYSGMASFSTLTTTPPLLTSVDGQSYPANPWTTDTTPTLLMTRSDAGTIAQANARIFTNVGQALVWDSGWVNVADGNTASITSGVTLVPGKYLWDARVENTTGAISSFSARKAFTINSPPNVPTNLSPTPGEAVANTLLPLFKATFSDVDTATLGDTANDWDIVIEEDDGTPVESIVITSGVLTGDNTYQYLPTDTTLVTGQPYRWRTRFSDSKDVYGPYSAWNSFILRAAPNGTIIVPSDGSIVNLATPLITWSYTGDTAQHKFTVEIDETDEDGDKIADIVVQTVVSSAAQWTVPAGYLRDDRYYDIILTVYDDDDVIDPSPSIVNVRVEQNPPDPIEGLSPTSTTAGMMLEWDTAIMKTTPVVHQFIEYRIYRRLKGDVTWQEIGRAASRSDPTYMDWYAGNNVMYQYRVTVVASIVGQSSIQVESPDDPDGGSFCEAILKMDNWSIVGADRSEEHIMELPVTDESHNRVVQQETFETLGSNRKVILRGFVLGHEGSITCVWTDTLVPLPNDPQRLYPENVIGRRLLDYVTNNKGPHILKSAFGDVWDVEFSGPQYQWSGGANLEVTLEWIEVGQTSQVSI